MNWQTSTEGVLSADGQKGLQFQIVPGEGGASWLYRRKPINTRSGPSLSKWGLVGEFAASDAAKAAAEAF